MTGEKTLQNFGKVCREKSGNQVGNACILDIGAGGSSIVLRFVGRDSQPQLAAVKQVDGMAGGSIESGYKEMSEDDIKFFFERAIPKLK